MSGPDERRAHAGKWRKGVAQSPTGCALASVGVPLFKCLLIGAVLWPVLYLWSMLPARRPSERAAPAISKETYEGIKLWMAKKEVYSCRESRR